VGNRSRVASPPTPLPTSVRPARRRALCSAFVLGAVLAVGSRLLVGVVGADGRQRIHYGGPTGHRAAMCRAPRVTGLVLGVAREHAAKAGCSLRLMGAPVQRATMQTISRQSPRPGGHARVITVWVNPLCSGSAARGPGLSEPFVTSGPTELVSGLYLAGGPLRHWSEPRCDARVGTPGAGTITVSNAAGTIVVATQSVTEGKLARIPLAPGAYTLTGTFANATSNGQQIRTRPQIATIPRGETVRQDVVESIP